ncbi:TetR/AcrR family transcriptional regulator [Silvibacterium acidisoli]|uniref:TetR/AcrR family transcriptional regulator n=1 Tax=Acidobacteriaceae bacterium ZG23-2 TaxID=2883246 RepID=UPI00406CB3FC
MARARSPEKRTAILEAAIEEIATSGLGAATAKIASRAGIASGTLFTYFPTKDDLLNELYLYLKLQVYARLNAGFPPKASLERRAWHIWSSYLNWSIEYPKHRNVSTQLHVSNIVTPETNRKVAQQSTVIARTMEEVAALKGMKELPGEFASALMSSLQEAAMDTIALHPKQRDEISRQAFKAYWRAVR